MTISSDQASVIAEFWAAHDEALFPQSTIEAVTNRSGASFERARWAGFGGPMFIKLGRSVRYKKSAVLAWFDSQPPAGSEPSTERAAELARGRAVHQGG